MRLATHDQLALAAVAARPAGEAGGDDLLCQRVELSLAFLEAALDLSPDLGKGAAANPRVEEVARFDQSRGRQADRDIEHAIFNLTVLSDENNERALRLQ